jgi:hypothetical protein
VVPRDPGALLLKGLASMDAGHYAAAEAALDAVQEVTCSTCTLSMTAARARLDALRGNEAAALAHMDVLNRSRLGEFALDTEPDQASGGAAVEFACLGRGSMLRNGGGGPQAAGTLEDAEILQVSVLLKKRKPV